MNPTYLETASRIGARLCRDALWSDNRCNWTADVFSEQGNVHAALGPNLYAGTAGIAFFLWRLWKATDERIFQIVAEAALRQALSKLPGAGPGLYSGGLGVLFAAAEMRGEFDEGAVLAHARPDRAELDLISGSAGVIAVLLALYARTGSTALLDRAIRHGELLLKEARVETGWSWRTLNRDRHLTGFSHGAAGIGWAAFELWSATDDKRFHKMGLQAFLYERSCFSEAERNWPDYRHQPPAYPVMWCHGAAGIALSRLRCWSLSREPVLLEDVRTALPTVLAHAGDASNYCLCHGEAGNADVLLYATQVLYEPECVRAVERIAGDGIERFERRSVPWPCGVPGAHETPELMTGLAGIGYFYLRLADPTATPSILLPGI
jgi:lantibiotic modifying enzyme